MYSHIMDTIFRPPTSTMILNFLLIVLNKEIKHKDCQMCVINIIVNLWSLVW